MQNRNNIVGLANRQWAGQPRNRGSIPGIVRRFLSSTKFSHRIWGPRSRLQNRHPVGVFYREKSGRRLKLPFHFHVMTRLGMSGAILLFLLTPSWHVDGWSPFVLMSAQCHCLVTASSSQFPFHRIRVSQDAMLFPTETDRTVECARRRRTQHAAFMLVIISDMLLVSHWVSVCP
jgi:hypothetical protein